MINAKMTSAALLAAMLALSGPAFAQTGSDSDASPSTGASDSSESGGMGSNTGSSDSRSAGEMNPAAGDGMTTGEGRNTTTGPVDNPGANADQPGNTKSDRDCTSQQTPC